MNRSIEQALTSLIPRYNGTLPAELIELAGSLLALSRTKASNLKAEEEIGRTYACANIACDRLKQSLNLPKIEPHPPCPPRIYNKLYNYLDGVLVVRKRGRPPKTPSAASTPAKSLPSRPTPTKTSSLAPFKATPSGSIPRRRGLQSTTTTKDIPPWIHPMIRGLCKGLSAPAAAPHILAGVTTILTQPPPVPRDATTNPAAPLEKLPALIAAVYFFVCTRLSGRETSGKQYAAQRKELVNLLTELREDEEIAAKIRKNYNHKNNDGDWRGWDSVGTKDIDVWLQHISSGGWLQQDWFKNIIEGDGLDVTVFHSSPPLLPQTEGGEEEEEDEEGSPTSDQEDVGDGNVRMGLGTMMQDRVDYLSAERRWRYRVWREGVLGRIERGEGGEGG